MSVYRKCIDLVSHGGTPSYFDITAEVKNAVAESGIKEGICAVISPHTTCSVFFDEYMHDRDENGDELLHADLNDALGKIIPDQKNGDEYRYPGPKHFDFVSNHEERMKYLPNGVISDLYNGDAHLRSTVIGNSTMLDVTEGKLGVSFTGYIYFVDFDRTRSRKRQCIIRIIGE